MLTLVLLLPRSSKVREMWAGGGEMLIDEAFRRRDFEIDALVHVVGAIGLFIVCPTCRPIARPFPKWCCGAD
jgi:hypothetical protein